MAPSKNSLDRLPKGLSTRWEAKREAFEARLREAMVVPDEAVTVAVALDGVMVPMKDAQRAQKRERSRARGQRTKGPAGYQEAGCATLSFYDAEGERLDTLCVAPMPEAKKATLKTVLSGELDTVLGRQPDLDVVTQALRNALAPQRRAGNLDASGPIAQFAIRPRVGATLRDLSPGCHDSEQRSDGTPDQNNGLSCPLTENLHQEPLWKPPG